MAEFYPQNVAGKEKLCIFAASFVRREHSSVGSEHLPYKQGVTSSNLVVPTADQKALATRVAGAFFV